MAELSSHTHLKYKATADATAYTELCAIKTTPDVFKEPERVKTTTLADDEQKYISGIRDVPDMKFTSNYNVTEFKTIQALQGKTTFFELDFGDNGESGKFQWSGDIFYNPKGQKVGEVREAEITCYPSTDITPVFPTA